LVLVTTQNFDAATACYSAEKISDSIRSQQINSRNDAEFIYLSPWRTTSRAWRLRVFKAFDRKGRKEIPQSSQRTTFAKNNEHSEAAPLPTSKADLP
jgi:hypothetical protein